MAETRAEVGGLQDAVATRAPAVAVAALEAKVRMGEWKRDDGRGEVVGCRWRRKGLVYLTGEA